MSGIGAPAGNVYALRHGHQVGRRQSATYKAWGNMKQRCFNPRNNRFYRYGGRGITVCERWLVFENFLADMGEKPAGLTLERINNDGNYEPGNCRWAPATEQARNRSNPWDNPEARARIISGRWGDH